MKRRFITIITMALTFLMVSQVGAIQQSKDRVRHSKHSLHQTKPKNEKKAVELPENIQNPVSEIPSTEDFTISATINNIGIGMPIIQYKFGSDKNYFKRALKRTESGDYEINIFSAALTDNKIDYYIEISTGSKTLANFGSENDPVTVQIIHPKQSKSIIWVILLAVGVFVVVKVVSIQRAYFKEERNRTEKKRNGHASKQTTGAVR